MKRIYLLVLSFVALFIGGSISAQSSIDIVFSDSAFTPTSTNICSGNAYTIYTGSWFSSMPASGGTGQIDINWGDGNTTSQAISFSGTPGFATYTPNLFNHTFATGIYTATFIYADNVGNNDTVYWNINATPYCGNVYSAVMLDYDGDGIGDVSLNNSQIDFTDGASNTTTYTQASNVIAGVDVTNDPYSLTVNPAWMAANHYVNVQPASQTLNFGTGAYVQLPNFVVQCDPAAPASQVDLAINYFHGSLFRAGLSTGYVNINVCNYTCSGTQSGNLSITFDPLLTVSSHNIPGATVTGNTISANILLTGCQNYSVYFSVPGPTPAGTPLAFSANINAVGATDFNLANNNATLNSEVRNSWDPNDKSVNRPAIVSPSVLDEFTYVVRFQNMGNDDAYNILVKDTLDNDLDLSTFSLLELSHNGSVSIDATTRIATFSFPNINLPAASVNEPLSHGYLVYKIKENAGLPIGTEIKNTAYIYFDYNPPIITNTTSNINQNMGVDELVADEFAAYPVPASDYLVISSKQNQPMESIRLVDITGKTVLNVINGGVTFTLDLQGIASGAYNLVIQSNGSSVNKKIMVRK